MVRKARAADTAAGALKAMLDAAAPLAKPPAQCAMRDGDLPFWDAIVKARAKDEWTDANLVVAAQLARVQHDIEVQQAELDAEGTVVRNDKGTQIANPRCTVLERMSSRQLSLMRALSMVGDHVVDKRDLQGKRKIEQSSRKLRDELEDDALLA